MVFVLLFVMQVRVLYQVGTRTDIAVDHSDDATFQINFKLELPSLSCEWATVDVIDALGSRHFNISGEGIYKHSMGASHYLGRDEEKGAGGRHGEEEGMVMRNDCVCTQKLKKRRRRKRGRGKLKLQSLRQEQLHAAEPAYDELVLV